MGKHVRGICLKRTNYVNDTYTFDILWERRVALTKRKFRFSGRRDLGQDFSLDPQGLPWTLEKKVFKD